MPHCQCSSPCSTLSSLLTNCMSYKASANAQRMYLQGTCRCTVSSKPQLHLTMFPSCTTCMEIISQLMTIALRGWDLCSYLETTTAELQFWLEWSCSWVHSKATWTVSFWCVVYVMCGQPMKASLVVVSNDVYILCTHNARSSRLRFLYAARLVLEAKACLKGTTPISGPDHFPEFGRSASCTDLPEYTTQHSR
jgi:hypothetical protein